MTDSANSHLPSTMVLAATPICYVEKQQGGWQVVDANPAFCALFYANDLEDDIYITAPSGVLSDLLTKAAADTRSWQQDITIKNHRLRVYSSGGEPQMWFFADVTDLLQAATDANSLSEMKSLFLATMSHEIRTPLQPIYGLLEIMSHQTTDPALLDTIGAARTSASQLLLILDDVLDLAKVEAGKMELDRFEVPLRTLIDGVVTTLAGKARAKNLLFESVIDADVPQVVMGDPKRLRQILLNLASNAVKFTKDGGSVRLCVSAHEPQPDGAITIRFEIKDSGIGLPPEQQQEIFNPFHQADKALSRKLGGTGLGLSICSRLVELMGGNIGCVSVLNKGSTFWFTVPTHAVKADVLVNTSVAADLTGLLILSVEDHPQGAKSIQMSLESMGASVDSVPTVEDAVKKLSSQRYDLAIIDQGLPDGEGIQLLRMAAKQQPGMGLILYTVFDTGEIQETIKSMGAMYLAKPASRLGLGQAVAETALKIKHNPAAKTRLLLIEDTESVQDVLERQLQHLGFSDYDMCSSGAEAFELLKNNNYGLIICDVHMPEIDGYEIVRRLAADEQLRDIPVIALTADVTLAQASNYSKSGFRECLLKPISVDQLRRVLMRWGIIWQAGEMILDALAPAEPSIFTPPKVYHLDIEALEQHYGAFDADVVRSLQLFVRLSGAMLVELKRGAAEQNPYIVRSVAHSLKGSAATAHCPKLAEIAGQIQQLAMQDKTEYGTLIEEVSLELAAIADEIALFNDDVLNALAAAKTANTQGAPVQPISVPASTAENPDKAQSA